MKSFVKKFALLVMAALLGVFPVLTVLASPPAMPHRNPAQAAEERWLDQLFIAYASVFNLINAEDFQSANDLLGEINQSEVPSGLSYFVQRGTALGLDLNMALGNVRALLDEASSLLDDRQLDAAGVKLGQAGGQIENARQTIAELREAVDALSQRSGFTLMPLPLSQAYDRVSSSLSSLDSFIAEFEQLKQKLEEARLAILQSGLAVTDLQIDVSPLSVLWGENITISGKLTGEGKDLGGRAVSLLVGEHRQTVITRDDGSYFDEIAAIPDDYSGNLAVVAFYQATGEDASLYLPAQSQTVTVRVGFNATLLEVTAPESGFAGQPVTVNGRIIAGDLTRPRTIKVFFDGALLTEGDFGEDFTIGIRLLVSSTPGEHYLEVAALPKGSYAGANRRLPINLLPGIVTADLKAPGVVFLPGTVRLSGQAFVAGKPLSDALVTVEMGKEQARAVTASDGSFEMAQKVPFNLLLMGPQKLTIDIMPDESWLEPLQATRTLTVISPVPLAFLALVLAIFIFLVIRLAAARRQALPAPATATVQNSIKPVTAAFPLSDAHGASSRKSEVLSAYGRALELVAGVCGSAPEAHTTLREYLAVARGSNGAYEPFKELTSLAELVLYAPRVTEENLAIHSAKLLDDIKRELRK